MRLRLELTRAGTPATNNYKGAQMLFRLSEDGKTQVNMAQVSRVAAVPCTNGIGAVVGFQIVAYPLGEASTGRVVLKSFECKAEHGADAEAQERRAAQKALDYLAGLPTTVMLEGMRELIAMATKEAGKVQRAAQRAAERVKLTPKGEKLAARQ